MIPPTATARTTTASSASASVNPLRTAVLILNIGIPLTVVSRCIGNQLQRLWLVDPAGGVVRQACRRHRAPIWNDQNRAQAVEGIDWHFLQIRPELLWRIGIDDVAVFVGRSGHLQQEVLLAGGGSVFSGGISR